MTEIGRTLGMGEQEALEGAYVEAPFGRALVEAARDDDRIVGLTADLGKYTDIQLFAQTYPDRFFNVGMAEQNLIAVSAGLAKVDHIAFCTTYGVFATRRAYDFIAIACAHSNLNVKIIAGLPGLTTGYGGTHQAIEDTGLARLIPGLVVLDPCDAVEVREATLAIAEYDGPVYMRLPRGKVPVLLDPDAPKFAIGKARRLRQGKDVGIISTGLLTGSALKASETLRGLGIEAGVLHVPCIKPFDRDGIAAFAAGCDVLITAENHVIDGGLGTLVVQALYGAGVQKPLRHIGLPDQFIECGSVPYLQQKYGITAGDIVNAARQLNN
ncbi:transketolase family protein [Devosia sp. A369]